MLERLVGNEERYLSDITTLVDVYYRPIKTAIASELVSISWTKLDAMFLNWYSCCMSCSHLSKSLYQGPGSGFCSIYDFVSQSWFAWIVILCDFCFIHKNTYSESLLTFHKLFFSQMKRSIALPNAKFGQLLLRFIPHLRLYVEFIKSQGESTKVMLEYSC